MAPVAGTLSARCPHSTRDVPERCSQCLGITVARIVPVDNIDAIIMAAPKTKPTKVHWRERQKRQAAARERQKRELAARAAWSKANVITARVAP